MYMVPHTPYSPDLMPCDFFMFPTGKRDLEKSRFEFPRTALGAVETAFQHLIQHVFDK